MTGANRVMLAWMRKVAKVSGYWTSRLCRLTYMYVYIHVYTCICNFCISEAKVVSGLFTLKTVSYRTEFDREGSQERHDLMSLLADEVCMELHSVSCCSMCFHSNI